MLPLLVKTSILHPNVAAIELSILCGHRHLNSVPSALLFLSSPSSLFLSLPSFLRLLPPPASLLSLCFGLGFEIGSHVA